MTWVRLDDTFCEDARIEAAGPLALALYVAALCYSNRNLTDGAVSKTRVRRLLALDDADAVMTSLIEHDLWSDAGAHIVIVDFHEWQPSREDIEKRRADAMNRQRAWREKRRNAVTDNVTNGVTNRTPYPTRPDPKGGEGKGGSSADADTSSAGAPAAPSTASPTTSRPGFEAMKQVGPNQYVWIPPNA